MRAVQPSRIEKNIGLQKMMTGKAITESTIEVAWNQD